MGMGGGGSFLFTQNGVLDKTYCSKYGCCEKQIKGGVVF